MPCCLQRLPISLAKVTLRAWKALLTYLTISAALIGKGYHVKLYDKNVSLARLHGANRAYIEHTIPHVSSLMCNSIEEVLDDSDVIVIGNKAPEFAAALENVRQDQTIIDLVRASKDTHTFGAQYQGICW